jgi:hypothetical protein
MREVWVVVGVIGATPIEPEVFPIEREDEAKKHYLNLVDELIKRPNTETGEGRDEEFSVAVFKQRAIMHDRDIQVGQIKYVHCRGKVEVWKFCYASGRTEPSWRWRSTHDGDQARRILDEHPRLIRDGEIVIY